MNGGARQNSILGAAATLVAAVSIWGVNVAYQAGEDAHEAIRKSEEAIIKAEQARPDPWTGSDQRRHNAQHTASHREERRALDQWILAVLESMKNEIWRGVPPKEVSAAFRELRAEIAKHDKRLHSIESHMYGPRR